MKEYKHEHIFNKIYYLKNKLKKKTIAYLDTSPPIETHKFVMTRHYNEQNATKREYKKFA